MSIPRASVIRRAPLPSAWATYTSVLSFCEAEKSSRDPSGEYDAPVEKSPRPMSERTCRDATSTVYRCAPPPSRKLVKAIILPSGLQEGSRLMEAPVSGCTPKPSQSETITCLPVSPSRTQAIRVWNTPGSRVKKRTTSSPKRCAASRSAGRGAVYVP